MTTDTMTVLSADSISAASFEIDTIAIKAEADQMALLTIAGPEDKEGFRQVKEARLSLKKIRTQIENRRKLLKEGSIAYGKKVDSVAKQLTALVAPVESVLDERETKHWAEIQAIEDAKLDARMEKLAAVGCQSSRVIIKPMTDKAFDAFLEIATAEHEKAVEAARIAEEERRQKEEAEAEARRQENERLKAEREKLDAERREFEEKQRQENEARRKLENEQAEKRAKEEAALQAQRDEIARQQAKIDAANAERERKEREQAEAEETLLVPAEEVIPDSTQSMNASPAINPKKSDIIALIQFLDLIERFMDGRSEEVGKLLISDEAKLTHKNIFGLVTEALKASHKAIEESLRTA